jgi:hypothetical protein
MAIVLGVVVAVLAVGRAIYPAPIRWRARPWFIKSDRQGRIVLAAFGCLLLLLVLVSALA